MGYGHADKIARITADAPAAGLAIDPALYRQDDVRRVLAEHDIAALYLTLKDAGLTQRQIAELTGQSQSEVSEILDGRKVASYDLLVRIAKGLSIPRELMGLSFGAYSGDVTVANPPEGVSVEVLRRRLIELGGGLAVAASAAKLAPLLDRLELPDPSPVPLPSRLSGLHVEKVRDLTRRAYGSDPEVSSAAAAWASRLLDVSGRDAVRKALMVAVAELHIEAGWGAFDAGLYDRAMHHYGHALKLGTEAGDAYCQALALNFAGLATVEHGQPNNGLKLLQVGTVTALGIPDGEEQRLVKVGGNGRSAVQACAGADSATALADLDEPEKATPHWRKPGSCGSPPPPTLVVSWIVPPPCWSLTVGGWMWQSSLQQRQCAAGRVAANAATRTPASCWLPSTSGPVSRAGFRWRTARSARRTRSAQYESAGAWYPLPMP